MYKHGDGFLCYHLLFAANSNIGVVIALWAPIVLVSSFPFGAVSVAFCFSKLILFLMSKD